MCGFVLKGCTVSIGSPKGHRNICEDVVVPCLCIIAAFLEHTPTVKQGSPLSSSLEAEMLLQSEVPQLQKRFEVEGSLRKWNAAYAAWCDTNNYCSKNNEEFDLEEFMAKKKIALGMRMVYWVM